MSDWVKTTLGEFAAPGRSIISGPFGSDIGTKFFKSKGVPVIRGNNLTTDHRKFVDEGFVFVTNEKADELDADAIEDDFIFTAAGTIGQVGIIPKACSFNRYVISNKQIRVRVDPNKVDLNYLYAWLSSPWIFKAITNRDTGSTVPLINLSVVRSLPVFIPKDISIQEKIGDIFRALDAKIELNNRIKAELENLAKVIYDYWFLQFDFPNMYDRPYKSSGGAMVWSDTLKREIPEGWEVIAIGQACVTALGGTPHTKNQDYWEDANIPWLSSGEVSRFPITDAEQFITEAGILDSAAQLLPPGTVVVSIVRYIRPSILCIAAATNQSVVGIHQSEQFPSSYLYPMVCREVPRWMSLRTGAQQPHINKSTIDNTLMLKPERKIVDSYRKIADPIFSRIYIAAAENYELTKLRDWLLPLLMNGQVRVV